MTGYLELTKGEASFALRGPFAITRAGFEDIYQHMRSLYFLPSSFDPEFPIVNRES